MTSHFIAYFKRRADALADQLHSGMPQSSSASSRAAASSSSPADDGSGEGVRVVRKPDYAPLADPSCVFCDIVQGSEPAFKVYEDDHVVAFLDILPIREGHTLVIPKQHFERVSHMTDDAGAALGAALPRISRAICRAMDQPDFNIVSNQGYAQVVHHVHFHLVPAPSDRDPTNKKKGGGWAPIFGRDELDPDEAETISARIRAALEQELSR